MSQEKLPQVVIVGAGFGGLRLARKLSGLPVRVLLVDKRNFHLFQPLLYQVATAGLSPEDIANPVRGILRQQKNLEFRMTEVLGINFQKHLLYADTGDIAYDYLILAVGGVTNYFGLESAAKNALGLKDLNDAILIRNRILHMFELADHETESGAHQALLTFVVVGGGATGVESAGALSELVQKVFVKDYHRLEAKDVRIILLEASSRLLPGMPEECSAYALNELRRKGVEVSLDARVADFDGYNVTLADQSIISCRTMIWAAGVQASPLNQRIDSPKGSGNRLVVNQSLQLPNHNNIFALGDAAFFLDNEKPLPMIAPVAVQQADLMAVNMQALLKNQPLQTFSYKDPGMLATIGRNSAVAKMGKRQFYGIFAWFLWLVIHILRLIGFRNRLMVIINWTWDYFFYERSIRLITPDLCPDDKERCNVT